jgi:hypothetical protein
MDTQRTRNSVVTEGRHDSDTGLAAAGLRFDAAALIALLGGGAEGEWLDVPAALPEAAKRRA